MITDNTQMGIKIKGHKGTWGVIDSSYYKAEKVFLLEHDYYGDEAASLIVNKDGKIIQDQVWNGFDDLESWWN